MVKPGHFQIAWWVRLGQPVYKVGQVQRAELVRFDIRKSQLKTYKQTAMSAYTNDTENCMILLATDFS